MNRGKWLYRHLLIWVALAALATGIIGCQHRDPLPENIGHLRSAGGEDGGKLIIFDADTFEIHRSEKLPKATASVSHRLEIDPSGRVWIGYSQWNLDNLLLRKAEVLVLSPQGKVEHKIDMGCDPPQYGDRIRQWVCLRRMRSFGFPGRLNGD